MMPRRALRAMIALAAVMLLLALGRADARFSRRTGRSRTPPRSDQLILRVDPEDGDVIAAAQDIAAASDLTFVNDIGHGFVVLASKGDPPRADAARLAIAAAMERGAGHGGSGAHGSSAAEDTTPLDHAVARAKVSNVEEDAIMLPMAAPTECASSSGCVSGSGGVVLWAMTAIRAPALWNSLPGTLLPGSEVHRGGVIDTGAQFNHVELVGQLNSALSRGYKSGSVVSAADTDGHGSHVSGSLAANWNNGQQGALAGVVGSADLVHCRFLFSNGGTTSDAVLCLDYLRANGVVITNNSWGGGGYTLALLEAIRRVCAAGGLFVAAAGNSGVNIAGGAFPAAYASYSGAECVLPVAATDSTNTLASFSNWGATVPIGAPGVNIRSAVYSSKSNNREATWSGTSMAAPHVTGVALFLKNALPALNGTKIKKAIVESATVAIKPYGTNTIGGKLLDAEAAYALAATM